MFTEYLMKCAEVSFPFAGELTDILCYQDCYIAKKDDMVILIKSKDILDRIIEDIKTKSSSDVLQNFGVTTAPEQLHFDTLIGMKGVELFIGYENIRIKF